MEHLWAPWRNIYVKDGTKHEGNVFARIAQGTDDEANFVLIRGKSCFAVLNIYPYNTGHLMIIPYRLTGDLDELSDDESLEGLSALKTVKAALTAAFHPQGFNIGLNLGAAAGAGIEAHLHWHIVPRWSGDANFITTVGGVRVHPNELGSVYRLLKEKIG